MSKPERVQASAGSPATDRPTRKTGVAPVNTIEELRRDIAKLQADIAASDAKRAQKIAAAAPAARPKADAFDLAFEAAIPPFPDEVAETRVTQAVRAAATPVRGGALPGAREALGRQYAAVTGRTWTVAASAAQDAAPEPFPGSGDRPLATASGLDPQLLSKARWQDRWAITSAPTQQQAAQLLNASAGHAADFGSLSPARPPTGLDDEATAYVAAYRSHLSGFPSDCAGTGS